MTVKQLSYKLQITNKMLLSKQYNTIQYNLLVTPKRVFQNKFTKFGIKPNLNYNLLTSLNYKHT